MGKHTPGPWKVGARENSGNIRVYSEPARNMSQLGKTLAFVSAPVVPAKKGESEAAYQARRREIEDANARLIAAAPDMLEALTDALACIDADADVEAYQRIEAAIRKATT